MTKYKEYLRAKGIKLECDYEEYCNGIVEIATGVLANGIVVGVHHENVGYHYAVYNRSGDCSYFNQSDFEDYIEDSRDDPDYIYWLHEMHCNESYVVYNTMLQMYQVDENVRVAFNHVKAGIMDFFAFYGWISDRYQEYINS